MDRFLLIAALHTWAMLINLCLLVFLLVGIGIRTFGSAAPDRQA